MALQKEITLSNGQVLSYWWMEQNHYQVAGIDQMRGFAIIGGYTSKEYRDADSLNNKIQNYQIEITPEMFDALLEMTPEHFAGLIHVPIEMFNALYEAFPAKAFYAGVAAMLYKLFQVEVGGLLEGAEWVE